MSKIFAPSSMLEDNNFVQNGNSCLTINNNYSYNYVTSISSGNYCTYVVYPEYDYMYRKSCSSRNIATTCNGFTGNEFTFTSSNEYRFDFLNIILLTFIIGFVGYFFVSKVIRGVFLGWRWS